MTGGTVHTRGVEMVEAIPGAGASLTTVYDLSGTGVLGVWPSLGDPDGIVDKLVLKGGTLANPRNIRLSSNPASYGPGGYIHAAGLSVDVDARSYEPTDQLWIEPVPQDTLDTSRFRPEVLTLVVNQPHLPPGGGGVYASP